MRTVKASASLDLSKDEQARVRAALQFLRRRMGGWETLAKALHFTEKTLSKMGGHATVTPTCAFRVARLVSVPIDDLLAGRFPAPGACPYCGHVPDPRQDAEP